MQDEQAHFSPSMTGIPRVTYGRMRSSQLAGGSRAGGRRGGGRRSRRNGNEKGHTARRERAGKDTVKENSMESMLNQTPEGILVNGMLDEDRERREETEDDRVESGEGREEWSEGNRAQEALAKSVGELLGDGQNNGYGG